MQEKGSQKKEKPAVTHFINQVNIEYTTQCQSEPSGKIFYKYYLLKVGLNKSELSWFGLPAHFQRQGEGDGRGRERAEHGKQSLGTI